MNRRAVETEIRKRVRTVYIQTERRIQTTQNTRQDLRYIREADGRHHEIRITPAHTGHMDSQIANPDAWSLIERFFP